MIYRLPEKEDQVLLQDYVLEHYENHEAGISASLGLTAMAYTEWVEKIHKNAAVGDDAWGRSLLYLCFDQQKLIGLLSIRYELPEDVTKKYGDIGYGVRPSERNKGYATRMLQYGVKVCKEKGMKHVILGCYQDNGASVRVIEKSGGVLIAENENYTEGRKSLYYRINL
jgi:predicted acetyltransferase